MLFQLEGFLDRKIGMEPLVINWANEEAKMAKIIRHIYVAANNSIFRSIMQYFLARSIALKECYLMTNFEKNSLYRF